VVVCFVAIGGMVVVCFVAIGGMVVVCFVAIGGMVVVCFVAIGGMVDHHCLIFLFIMLSLYVFISGIYKFLYIFLTQYFQVKDDDKEEKNRDCHYYFTPDLASFGLKNDSDGFLLTTPPFIINETGKKLKGVNVLQIAALNVKPMHCPNATQKVKIIVQVRL
jgi:Na+(H+)/acetate symporter ActP